MALSNRMKRILLPILTALTVAACSKVNVSAPQPGRAVRFAVVNHLQQTKAPTAGLTYPTSVPFGTFAWWTSGDWTGIAEDQTYVFMNNQEVSYHSVEGSSTSVWAPTTTYYWTRTGKITFASYSPYTTGSGAGYSEVPVYDVTKGFLFNNYTIVDDTNIDLMYANLAPNCVEEYNSNGEEVSDSSTPEGGFSGVPTIFNHALCQVGFAFRAIGRQNPNVDRIVVDITDVDILNIDYKGSFTQIPATATTPKWATDHSNPATYEYAPATTLSLDLIENTAANVASTANYTALETRRILLPQALLTADLATDQLLQVKYTIKIHYLSATTDETDPAYWATEDVTSTVRLNNGAIASWKENQNITYRISINLYSAAPITFDPAVADWDYKAYTTNINLDI